MLLFHTYVLPHIEVVRNEKKIIIKYIHGFNECIFNENELTNAVLVLSHCKENGKTPSDMKSNKVRSK